MLDGLADGRTTLNTMVRRLKTPKTTVLRARDFLLSAGALERSSAPGSAFYTKGPAYDATKAILGGSTDRARGVVGRARHATTAGPRNGPPRGFSKVTRGQRGIELLLPPEAPNLLPGYVRTVPQVPPSYVYAWEFEGRTWPIRLYRRSVQVSAPTPRMARRDVPGAAGIQDRWTDYASKVLHTWAQAGGLLLGRNRQAIREQSQVELEVARIRRQEGALSPGGLVEINGTPVAGTVETTSEEVAAQVENLPLTIPAHAAAIASLSQDMTAKEARLKALERAFLADTRAVNQATSTLEAAQGLTAALARHGLATTQVLAAQFQAAAGAPVAVASSSSTPPLPKEIPGVDYA